MMLPDDLAVLFLHPLPFDGRFWDGQKRLLNGEVHSPDLYEFGNDITVWATRCLELVTGKRIFLVGCSVGGSCALEIAHLAPERVVGMILVGTKAGHRPDPKLFERTVNSIRGDGIVETWKRDWRPLFQHKGSQASAEEIPLAHSEGALIAGITAFHTRPNREALLPALQMPVHIVTGARDRLPGLVYAERMASSLLNGRLHLIDAAGHYASLEQPEVFNALLIEAISEEVGLS